MSYFNKVKREIAWIATFQFFIWAVFILDQLLPLEAFGLRPRSLFGLIGIPSMAFLHGNLSHILSNTLPLLTLLLLLASFRCKSIPLVIAIVLIGGILLWLVGKPNSIHIGASLLVFGLAGYLITNGLFFQRKVINTIICIIVLFSYGGALFSGFSPWQQGVSWDGHLCGFIAGIAAAYLQSKSILLK